MAVSAVKSEPAPEVTAPPPAGKKGLAIKLALVAIIVIGAGGGAYWHFFSNPQDSTQEAKQAPAKPPVFHPLETFTVNLQLVDNPQFLQAGITLKVADNAAIETLKLHMPVVRDRILMLMSSRKATELLTVEGKRQLGDDIVASVNEVLAGGMRKSKPAAKAADAKGEDAKAADEEDEKDAKDEKDAADAKAAPAAEKSADDAKRPVQAVLFTSFIIQ